MHVLKTLGLWLLLGLAGLAQADSTVYAVPDSDRGRNDLAALIVPESLDIEMVDGIVYKGFKGWLRKGETQVYVLPGEREVALKYNQLFQQGANDHDIIKSKIIVLKFVAESGKAYRAKHAEFRNAVQARAGIENFVVQILDAEGNNRVNAASQVQKNWKGESTTTTRSDLVSAAAPTAPVVAAVVAMPATAPAATSSPAATPAAGGLSALGLLQFTWQNASAADRAAFLDWAKANP